MLLAGIGKLPDTVSPTARCSIPIGLECKPSAQKVKPLRAGDGERAARHRPESCPMGSRPSRRLARCATRESRSNFTIARPIPGHRFSPSPTLPPASGPSAHGRRQSSCRATAKTPCRTGFSCWRICASCSSRRRATCCSPGKSCRRFAPTKLGPGRNANTGGPPTQRQLAALLKPYKIKPKTVRRGTDTEKGYRLEWFADPSRATSRRDPSQRHNRAFLRVWCLFIPSFPRSAVPGCDACEA